MQEGQGPSPGEAVPLFVYGTLRPGGENWRVAAPWCLRAEPASLPRHRLYRLAHPAALPGRDDEAVVGDLLWLRPGDDEEALARLDAFEGTDPARPERSYYERVRRRVERAAGGLPVDAWVYLPGARLRATATDDRVVPGGDWHDAP